MTCRDVQGRMLDALLGEAGLRERILLGIHLLKCKACRRERKQYWEVLRMIRADSPGPPGVDFEGLLGRPQKRPTPLWIWKVAVPVCALGLLMLTLWTTKPQDQLPPSLLHPTTVLEVLWGLDDGTWERVASELAPEGNLDIDGLLAESSLPGYEVLLTAVGGPPQSSTGGDRR